MPIKLSWIAVCVLMGWTGVAVATPKLEEEDLALAYGDKSFVSIATGTRQPVRKAPSVATVITAEDIAVMGARTVDDALESVPGLHVSRSAVGYTVTYGVRGILTWSNPHVLMMINGIPVTSSFQGNRGDLPVSLPVENVARIEVIRGPGSALYGADAFAGTINVVTKTAADINGTQVGLRAGSFNSWDTWLQYGRKNGALEIAAYLKVGGTDGDRRTVRADAQTAIDTLLSPAPPASLAPGPLSLSHDDIDGQLDVAYDKLRFRAAYLRRSDVGVGAGIAGALDPVARGRDTRYTADVSWRDPNFAPALAVELQAAYLQAAYEVTAPVQLFPPGAFGGTFPNGVIGTPEKWERQTRVSAAGTYTGISDHRLRFGLGHDDLDLYKTQENKNFRLILTAFGPLPIPVAYGPASADNLFLAPHKRRLDYAYVQDEWSLGKDWTLTAGLRHDRYSDFGSTTNPRVALVWEARHDITAKLMYGSAFRAPAFVEKYATANPVAVGNPDLQPEKIRTLETAVTWQLQPGLETTLSLFRHEISDMIRIPTASTMYQNSGKQRGNGGELESAWTANSSLKISAHYAYQKNVDETTGHDAGYAPHHHFYARADWVAFPGWQLSGQVNHVADRKRPWGDNRPQIPDYTTLDLTLRSTRSLAGWDFSATIYNLFDSDVREPSIPESGIKFDLPMPGRTFWLQGRYNL